jgi:hypothetical protein
MSRHIFFFIHGALYPTLYMSSHLFSTLFENTVLTVLLPQRETEVQSTALFQVKGIQSERRTFCSKLVPHRQGALQEVLHMSLCSFTNNLVIYLKIRFIWWTWNISGYELWPATFRCVFVVVVVWVSVHHNTILYKEPTRCNFGSIVY